MAGMSRRRAMICRRADISGLVDTIALIIAAAMSGGDAGDSEQFDYKKR